MQDRARWAAVVVNYEAGPLLDGVRGVGARRHAARARSSSSSSTTARATVRSPRSQRAYPDVQRDPFAGQRRLRARREPRDRGDPAPTSIAVLNADTRVERGAAGRARRPARRRATARGGRAAASRTSTAPTTRRRGTIPSTSVAVMHGALGLWWPTNPFTTRYRQLDAAPDRARLGRLGVGRRGLAAAGRARRRRRLGRALLHVPRGRRPVLAVAARPAGRSRTNRRASSGTCRARAPRAGRTGCSPSTTGRRGVSPAVGTRACAQFCCRSRPCIWPRVASLGDGRARAGHAHEEARQAHRLACERHGQGLSHETTRQRQVRAQVARATSVGGSLSGVIIVGAVALIVAQPRRRADAAPLATRTTGTPRWA